MTLSTGASSSTTFPSPPGVVTIAPRLGARLRNDTYTWCSYLRQHMRRPQQPRDLGGVERQVLVLGHADGDGLLVAGEGGAAEAAAAGAVAADDARLVAGAHLLELDAPPRRSLSLPTSSRKSTRSSAKKVIGELAAVERLARPRRPSCRGRARRRARRQARLGLEPRRRGARRWRSRSAAVALRTHPLEAARRRRSAATSSGPLTTPSEVGAARGVDDDAVAGRELELAGVELVDLAAAAEHDAARS